MAVALFIKVDDIRKKSILSGSVDTDKFIQFVKIAQQIHITNYLGSKLYDRLNDGIIAGDLTAIEKTLLNDYVQDALIHYAAAEYLPFAAYNVGNGGVFKHTPENTFSVDKQEVDYLVQRHKEYANYYAKRLVDYLCNNSTLYAEYSTNVEDDIRPSKLINYSGGWYLDNNDYLDLLKYRNLEL